MRCSTDRTTSGAAGSIVGGTCVPVTPPWWRTVGGASRPGSCSVRACTHDDVRCVRCPIRPGTPHSRHTRVTSRPRTARRLDHRASPRPPSPTPPPPGPLMTAAPVTSAPTRQHGRLHHGALGLPSVLFCIVTGAAPLTAMLFNVPVAVNGGGYAAPAAFLLATIALTIFSVGYIAMCARVTSAGGFYTFVARGLGRIPGVGSGLLIALCYMVFVAAVIGVLGYFAATSVETWTGVSLPAWVYMAVALAIMSALAWFHIEL